VVVGNHLRCEPQAVLGVGLVDLPAMQRSEDRTVDVELRALEQLYVLSSPTVRQVLCE